MPPAANSTHWACHGRLRVYGRRCGVRVTPHQLRHSCATLLLNARAPTRSVAGRMELGEGADAPPPSSGELLALVDALSPNP